MSSCSMDSSFRNSLFCLFFFATKRRRERKSHPACFCPAKRSFPFRFFAHISATELNAGSVKKLTKWVGNEKALVMIASLRM